MSVLMEMMVPVCLDKHHNRDLRDCRPNLLVVAGPSSLVMAKILVVTVECAGVRVLATSCVLTPLFMKNKQKNLPPPPGD